MTLKTTPDSQHSQRTPVLDGNGGQAVAGTVRCLNCGAIIENPRIEKGKIVSKFCRVNCKNEFYNRTKTKKAQRALVREWIELNQRHQQETEELLRKYGLDR